MGTEKDRRKLEAVIHRLKNCVLTSAWNNSLRFAKLEQRKSMQGLERQALLDILVAKNALNDNVPAPKPVLLACAVLIQLGEVLPYSLTCQTQKLGLEGAAQLRRCARC